MKKPFPQVLKGAATAAGKQDRRVGLGTGPKPKPITMPKMPWDNEKDVDMNDIERFILLNQSMIMTALAQLMDRYSLKKLADSLDEASIKTVKFIKSFDTSK